MFRRQQEEEEKYRRLQEEANLYNEKIMEQIAEQERMLQEARSRTNELLDKWSHQLRGAAQMQFDALYNNILKALDDYMKKTEQMEQRMERLLSELENLRRELAGMQQKAE